MSISTCRSSSFSITCLLSLVLYLFSIQLSDAVRRGTVDTRTMIMCYERDGDYGKAALWYEAAADCLEIISRPMVEITIKYYQRYGMDKLAVSGNEELDQIDKQREQHLRSARLCWKKTVTDQGMLVSEKNKVDRFIEEWVSYYPNRFYDFGLYVDLFGKRQHLLLQKGDYQAALNLEADSAEMCADLYLKITIACFKSQLLKGHRSDVCRLLISQYEKVRDVHLQRAVLLRQLARKGRRIRPSEVAVCNVKVPKVRTKLTSDQATNIAKSCVSVKSILASHQGVRAYPWFQGFAWTVSFCNHGWGNLVTVIVDDQTGEVVDVLDQSKS